MSEEKGIESFIRPNLASLGGYSPHKSPDMLKERAKRKGLIKLDANENPYGCSPRVKAALNCYDGFNIYPDAGQTELRRLLSGYAGIGAEHIVAGSGSGDLIDLLLRLFVGQGDEVINCPPTFDLYRFEVGITDGRLIEVPRDENFAVDVKALKRAITARTKLVFLSNPNNPTGALTQERDILEILGSGIPVVVDEAYYEFSGETVVPLVKRYRNLMVLRTFSKWAGLAGLRIGYGIFPPVVASWLLKIKLPYNVNVAALVAVRESFGDFDYLKAGIKAIISERERLFGELAKFTYLEPLPPKANFILCRVLGGDARSFYQKLQDRGILVRYFDAPRLESYLRISVGKPEHTDALVRALKELGEE
jgi:histidinol-phosphate aminotransferase